MKDKKGAIIIAIIGAVSAVTVAGFTAWGTAGRRVSALDTQAQLLELTHTKDMEAIAKDFTDINGKLDDLLKHFDIKYEPKN